MAKFYKNPFAYNGDYEAIADGTQSSGKVSNEDGFTSDYELLKSDPNYRPVGRKEMNGIFNEITGAIHEIQTQGAAEYEEDFDGYKRGAVVKFYDEIYFLTTDDYEPTMAPDEDPAWLHLNILSKSKTVTVGAGGDFPALADAISYAQGLIVLGNARLEINFLQGYILRDQTLLDGVDLGFVDITSSRTIYILPSYITRSLEPGCKPVFGAKNGGVLPVIKAKFQFPSHTDTAKHGVAVLSGAKAVIGTGGGFISAPGASLYADGIGSEIVAADGYDASGSHNAIHAQNGAKVWADQSNLNGTKENGVYASDGSTVSIKQATISSIDGIAIFCEKNAFVSAEGVIITNTSEGIIYATIGGKIDARYADITSSRSIVADTGGEIIFDHAEITFTDVVVFVVSDAKISANDAKVSVPAEAGLVFPAYLRRGGEIRLYGTTLHDTASGANIEFSFPQDPNTLTGCGIIWADEP